MEKWLALGMEQKELHDEPAKLCFAVRNRTAPSMVEMLKGPRSQFEGMAVVSSGQVEQQNQ